MKKAITCVLIAVSACWTASQMAQAAETVPWFNSFEANTADVPITNDTQFGSWTGTGDATVTNLSYTAQRQTPLVSYPLAGDHNKVVMFNGALTNDLAADGIKNVWVDLMIQPVQMDTPPVSESISNSQMSIFVDTNGFINVYHGLITNNIDYSLERQWTVLDDFQPIATDKWVRLTITMDYNDVDVTGLYLFQIQANGHLFTNGAAYTDLDPITRTGTWFVCANNVAPKISSVSFSGTGMFDDLVVTNGAVDIQYLESPLLLAAPYNTPQWWLALYTNAESSLTITNDDTDVDGDGAREWQEYVAGTVPIDSNSVLKIISGQVANGTGTVVWLSTTNMPDTNAVKYVVQAATNLVEGTWLTILGSSQDRIEGALTNSSPALLSPAFFRVSFTNE